MTSHDTTTVTSEKDRSMTVTTTTSALAALLGSTVPFCGDSYDHPVLGTVRIEARDGVITATATNRYLVGHARKKASGDLPGPIALSRRDARRLRKTLSQTMRAHRSGDDIATLTHDSESGTLTVDFADVTMRLEAGASVEDGIFSSVRTVLAGLATESTASAEPVAVNPFAIKPLLKALRWSDSGPSTPLRWCLGGRMKPVRIEIEDWFVAAVMPVRVRAGQRHVPAHFLSAPEITSTESEVTKGE